MFLLTKKQTLVIVFFFSVAVVFEYSRSNLSLMKWYVIEMKRLIHDFWMIKTLCLKIFVSLNSIVITMSLNFMQLYWSIDKQSIAWFIILSRDLEYFCFAVHWLWPWLSQYWFFRIWSLSECWSTHFSYSRVWRLSLCVFFCLQLSERER